MRHVGSPHEHSLSQSQQIWAYVVFDASSGTPSITSQFNVSSITDNAIGDFTVNWALGFKNAAPPYITMCRPNTQTPTTVGIKEGTTPTATSVNITTPDDGNSHTKADALRAGILGFSNY